MPGDPRYGYGDINYGNPTYAVQPMTGCRYLVSEPSPKVLVSNVGGLTADQVTRSPEVGFFYAWLKPLALTRIDSLSPNGYTAERWSLDPSESGIVCAAYSVPMRYLWYKGTASPYQLDSAGPGAVYLERSTNRLFFLGPELGEDGQAIVIADWDVGAQDLAFESNAFKVSDVQLYREGTQVGWSAKPDTRFDLIG